MNEEKRVLKGTQCFHHPPLILGGNWCESANRHHIDLSPDDLMSDRKPTRTKGLLQTKTSPASPCIQSFVILVASPFMMDNNEVELSSFQMDYRPVHKQGGGLWVTSNDDGGFARRRRQKTLWVQGAAVAAMVIVLLAIFSPSNKTPEAASDGSTNSSNDKNSGDNRLHNENFKVVPEDESARAHFGLTISMHGARTYIAAPGTAKDGVKTVGRVYVYEGTQQIREILSPETTRGIFFGQAIDHNEKYMVIGAPGLSKVYCYSLNDMSLQTTVAPNVTDAKKTDNYGVALAMDGDTLIVGASLADGDTLETSYGRIYVYEQSTEGTFVELQSFESPSPQKGEMFGGTLALRGDYLVVGDFLRTTPSGESSGAVYIYKRGSDKTFELLQTLQAVDGGASHEGFGASVALSDTILVVGLNDREGRVMKSLNGGAFVYRKYDDEWKFEALLHAHDQAILNGQFGGGVAVDEETIVIGSQEMDEDKAGKVYIFEKNPVTAKWMDVAELAPSDPSEGHHFGRIVAIKKETVVVGAFLDDVLQRDGGSVYFFDLSK